MYTFIDGSMNLADRILRRSIIAAIILAALNVFVPPGDERIASLFFLPPILVPLIIVIDRESKHIWSFVYIILSIAAYFGCIWLSINLPESLSPSVTDGIASSSEIIWLSIGIGCAGVAGAGVFLVLTKFLMLPQISWTAIGVGMLSGVCVSVSVLFLDEPQSQNRITQSAMFSSIYFVWTLNIGLVLYFDLRD